MDGLICPAGNQVKQKFWLHDLSVAVNAGFPAHEIGAIIRHLRSQRDLLEGKWHEHFGN